MSSTLVTPPTSLVPSSPATVGVPGRRGDIQGLRAVAVLLVLAYHAGVPVIGGGFVGVDVFFVISGFLITGLIVREVETTGRLRFGRFYARRIRRLLPATAAVLLATAVMTAVALPVTRWESVLRDIGAAALYVVNWRLAAQSVDYSASEQASSPVQHFWSLAVEEQFYVVWPLVIVAFALLHRRFGWPLRRALAAGLALIAVPSLAWSLHYTQTSPAQAYFVTTTRLWELAAGALLVLLHRRILRSPVVLAHVLGWAGAVGIVASALLYTSATPFPGSAALLPVLSTAAVLAAGTRSEDAGIARLLSWRPLRQIGDVSYSLYLWHWPFVVIGTAVFGGSDGQLWWVVGVLLVCTSVVPAWFTYVVVEQPIHTARSFLRPRAVLATLLVCTFIPVTAAAALQLSFDRRVQAAAAEPRPDDALGAVALGDDPSTSPAGETPSELGTTVPDVTVAAKDNHIDETEGCHQTTKGSSAKVCASGDRSGTTKVALVGDSHAVHWQPALELIALERGWQLDTWTKSACGLFDVEVVYRNGEPFEACTVWRQRLMPLLLDSDYDLVITTGSNDYTVVDDGAPVTGARAHELLGASYARVWTELTDAGFDVVALANTPHMAVNVPECLAAHSDDVRRCATSRAEALSLAADSQAQAAELAPQVPLIDLNDWICPREECSPVIGGVITYRDDHHLTQTYAQTLAPRLAEDLDRVGLPR